MPLRSGSDLPSVTGATEWVGGEPSLVPGQPVFVHFWSVSCHLCHENMPAVREWKAKYEPQGLQFVAIHMPRQEEDLDTQKVKTMGAEMSIDEPMGIDNERAVSDAFESEWAPAYFLFDSDWKLKGRAAGVYGVKMIGTALEKLF